VIIAELTMTIPPEVWTRVPEANLEVIHAARERQVLHLLRDDAYGWTIATSADTSWAVRVAR